jgi:hypothetical protein
MRGRKTETALEAANVLLVWGAPEEAAQLVN